MKKIIFLTPFLLFLFFIFSCSDTDESYKNELYEKLENMPSKEILQNLLIKCDRNYNQLACVLNCSPYSLKRISKGKSSITNEGLVELKRLYGIVYIENIDIDNVKNNCEIKKWYHYVWDFSSNWTFWIIFTIISFLLVETQYGGLYIAIYMLYLILFIIIGIVIYFNGESYLINEGSPFIDKIDSVWEFKY